MSYLDSRGCEILFISITALTLFIFLPLLKAIIAPLLIVLLGYLLLRTLRIDKWYDIIECIILSLGLGSLIAVNLVILADIIDIAEVLPFLFVALMLVFTVTSSVTRSSPKRNDKYVYMVSFIVAVAYLYAVFTRNGFIKSYPDECTYWTVAVAHKSTELLPDLDQFISSPFALNKFKVPSIRFFFMGLLRFTAIITQGKSFFFIRPLIIMFWAGSGLVTFKLGTIKDRLTGLIACIIFLTNPILWLWNNRVVPDPVLIFFAASSFYFFYKAFDSAFNRRYFLSSLMFFTLAFFTKPIVALWIPPFLIYLYMFKLRNIRLPEGRSNNTKRNVMRLSILPVCIVLLIIMLYFYSDGARWILLLWPSIMLHPILNFNSFDWYDFLFTHNVLTPKVTSIGGIFTYEASMDAWGTFLQPHFYSYPVLILIFAGLLYMFHPEKNASIHKRGRFMFLGTIAFVMWITSTLIGTGAARHSLFQLPLLATLAAIGFTSRIGKKSLILLFLLPVLRVIHLGIDYHVLDFSGIDLGSFWPVELLSISVAIVIICWKILDEIGHTLSRVKFIIGNKCYNLSMFRVCWQVKAIVFFFVLITSCLTCNYFIANRNIDDRNFLFDLGFVQAGSWINRNIPEWRTFVTNIVELKYYGRFVNITYPPDTLMDFKKMINNREVEYVVLYPNLRYNRWPYLKEFDEEPPPKMVEQYRYRHGWKDRFIIYKLIDEKANIEAEQPSPTVSLSTDKPLQPHRINLTEAEYWFIDWNKNAGPNEKEIYVKDNFLMVKIQAKEEPIQAACFRIEGIKTPIKEPLYLYVSMNGEGLEVYHVGFVFSNTTSTDFVEYGVKPNWVGSKQILLSRVDPSMSSLQEDIRLEGLQFWIRKVKGISQDTLGLKITEVKLLPEAKIRLYSMAGEYHIGNIQVEAKSVEAPYKTQNTTDKYGTTMLLGPVGKYMLHVGGFSIPEPIEVLDDSTLNVTFPIYNVRFSVVDNNGENLPESTIYLTSDNYTLSCEITEGNTTVPLIMGRVYNYSVDFKGVKVGEGKIIADVNTVVLKTNVYPLWLKVNSVLNAPLKDMNVSWRGVRYMTDKDGVTYLQMPEGHRKITLEKYGRKFELNVYVKHPPYDEYKLISLPVVEFSFGLYNLNYCLIAVLSLIIVLLIVFVLKINLRLQIIFSNYDEQPSIKKI